MLYTAAGQDDSSLELKGKKVQNYVPSRSSGNIKQNRYQKIKHRAAFPPNHPSNISKAYLLLSTINNFENFHPISLFFFLNITPNSKMTICATFPFRLVID